MTLEMVELRLRLTVPLNRTEEGFRLADIVDIVDVRLWLTVVVEMVGACWRVEGPGFSLSSLSNSKAGKQSEREPRLNSSVKSGIVMGGSARPPRVKSKMFAQDKCCVVT